MISISAFINELFAKGFETARRFVAKQELIKRTVMVLFPERVTVPEAGAPERDSPVETELTAIGTSLLTVITDA
jgi:hypothetical protein